MNHAVDVKGLRKIFGRSTAVHHVDFQVKQGEIFGLLGPSGSGKTTIVKMLTGELSPSAGDVKVLGTSYEKLGTSDFKTKIGILSDNSALYERLTVYDNLTLFCKLYDTPMNQIEVILREIGLHDQGVKTVSKLSKGMKQRILLAKALIHKPELVFLDEPTSALDPASMARIHRGLQKLNEAGTTIVLTTHNMEEATELCDRVAFLHQGEFQEVDSPASLRYAYSTHAFHVETFSGEQLVIENEPDNAERIKQLIQDGSIKTMQTDHPTLGQIFLKVTGKELV
ncbi:ABC transporter ATP-binding protein [Salibacterium halotolerans]|uniref:ABC-2 type transport system ATP-binding protein n=1 Tax=Salibacterium halotolerans TaxID=1884432 RepID=A0A1I5Y4H0_9BACI|nr:ABC transporter ATP-binding protein [Salibacterium halotolerans]SFQ39132.1 ABC-2 type transport system ATP-binding protein [Salibacterium halotolerans]